MGFWSTPSEVSLSLVGLAWVPDGVVGVVGSVGVLGVAGAVQPEAFQILNPFSPFTKKMPGSLEYIMSWYLQGTISVPLVSTKPHL